MSLQSDNLEADLQDGFVPISKAGASIAAMIKRSREQRRPMIITQKGYPVAALLSLELYLSLRERAERATKAAQDKPASASATVDAADDEQLQGEALTQRVA